MAPKIHGTYDHIAEAYEAVLHLIGSGWAKDRIIVIMSSTVPVSDKLTGRRCREIRQKSLLESVFPLRKYSPESFAELSDQDKELIRPYIRDLDKGRIVLVLDDTPKA